MKLYLDQTREHSITISEGNKKMGYLPSFSTSPGVQGSCPINCNGCYAMKMEKIYPSVRKSYSNNLLMAVTRMKDTFEAISNYLSAFRPILFRWHVSGDIMNKAYLTHMILLAEKHPTTQFFAFTKQYKIVNNYLDGLDMMQGLPSNLKIIFSGWVGLPMKNPYNLPIAWMQDGTETRVPSDAMDCPGDCQTCQKCAWIENGQSVVFEKH